MSDSSKFKMIETKRKAWLAKMQWETIPKELLDVRMSLGTRNRSTYFPTLREFMKMAKDGLSINDMIKNNCSKHVIYFMSKFCQGSLGHISRDKFYDAYSAGSSLDEIARTFSIKRDDACFLRQLFSIRPKGAKFINRKKTETPLTKRQMEIICGSLMGDACKMSSSSIKFVHGKKQMGYLLWKYEEMKPMGSVGSLKSTRDKKKPWLSIHRFYTHASTQVENTLSMFYPCGKKVISRACLDALTPLSMAVWYQDDGKTDWHYSSRTGVEDIRRPTFYLCTDGFSRPECELIATWFMKKWGIRAYVSTRVKKNRHTGTEKTYYRIAIGAEDVDKFAALVSPYMLPMFLYKINYAKYLEWRKANPIAVKLGDVSKCPIESFQVMSRGEQDEWVRKFVEYNRMRGFDGLARRGFLAKREVSALCSYKTSALIEANGVRWSKKGRDFMLSFFPGIWDARPKAGMSVHQVFENDSCLAEILRGILNEKRFPTKSLLMSRLRMYRGNKAPSAFPPMTAKAIYEKYASPNSRVLDFCGGWGGRLIGAMSAKTVHSYVACEQNARTYNGLLALYSSMRVAGITKEAVLLNRSAPACLAEMKDKSFDLCFTSPPYFDAERYDEDSCHTSYTEWFDGFLWPSILEACRLSKLVLINVANTGAYRVADDIMAMASAAGLLSFEHRIRFPKIGGGSFYEPLFGISRT